MCVFCWHSLGNKSSTIGVGSLFWLTILFWDNSNVNILKNCRAVHNKFDARRDVVRPFCLDFIWISKLPQTVLLIQPAFGWAGRFCPWTFVDCFRPCLHFPVFPSSFQVYFCLCCERYKFAREISRRCEARLSRFWTGAPTSSAPIFFFFGEQSFFLGSHQAG